MPLISPSIGPFFGTAYRNLAWAVSTTIGVVTYLWETASGVARISATSGSNVGKVEVTSDSVTFQIDTATVENSIVANSTRVRTAAYVGDTHALIDVYPSAGIYAEWDNGSAVFSYTIDNSGHTFVGVTSFGSAVTVPSLKIKDSGGDHVITLDTASDEAADRTLTIPALGGNKTLACIDLAQTFTAAQVIRTDTSPALLVEAADGTDRVWVDPATGKITTSSQSSHTAIFREQTGTSGNPGGILLQGTGYDLDVVLASGVNMRFTYSGLTLNSYADLRIFQDAYAPIRAINVSLVFNGAGSNGYQDQSMIIGSGADGVVKIGGPTTSVGGTFCNIPYSPSQITANQPNYAITGRAYDIRVSTDASRDLQGIGAGQPGEQHRLTCIGSNNFVIKHNSGSATGKVILCHGSADITLAPNDQALLWFDSVSDVWRAR